MITRIIAGMVATSTSSYCPAAAGSSALAQSRKKSTDAGARGPLADISAAKIRKTLTQTPKPLLPNNKLLFGKTFTDHMLNIVWDNEKGWHAPEVKPYGKLSLDPSATVFHYALECFEGLKAYKDKEGNIRLFRPDMNMKRLQRSCQRLTLPTFNEIELLECLKEFLRTDERWIPNERGYSLYVRPTVIATQESLGVGPSNSALLFVIASPVGPYYPTGFAAVSLYATDRYVRAWPGGTGDAKIGANYGPGIRPQIEVAKEGFQQNLWLFGEESLITEVGTMNFFMYWINAAGERELITPPLDGTILPGVTRDSILTLAREWQEFRVTEGQISMRDVVQAVDDGRVLEMFGAGTAAIVSPIKKIHFKGRDLDIPLNKDDKTSQAGPLTQKFADTIMGIQYGEIPHKWSVVV
ncbi:branched-chain-amino-acid aminotransferase [Borealophlyctis nickersoniae]|nr:branched-chain-amino-acid aminotransferase [Borealophlyctis nickersoniae]